MNIKWKIINLKNKTDNGFVVEAEWEATIFNENKFFTIRNFSKWDIDTPIIPFENLTEEIVLNWVFNKVNKQEIENKLIEKINEIENLTIVKSKLPWENNLG